MGRMLFGWWMERYVSEIEMGWIRVVGICGALLYNLEVGGRRNEQQIKIINTQSRRLLDPLEMGSDVVATRHKRRVIGRN